MLWFVLKVCLKQDEKGLGHYCSWTVLFVSFKDKKCFFIFCSSHLLSCYFLAQVFLLLLLLLIRLNIVTLKAELWGKKSCQIHSLTTEKMNFWSDHESEKFTEHASTNCAGKVQQIQGVQKQD